MEKAKRIQSKCSCGKRKSKYLDYCPSCYKIKNDKRIAEAKEIVQKGICPICGGKLKRNLSLAGWWQCEQLGAEIFRKDPTKPSCSFQIFTV